MDRDAMGIRSARHISPINEIAEVGETLFSERIFVPDDAIGVEARSTVGVCNQANYVGRQGQISATPVSGVFPWTEHNNALAERVIVQDEFEIRFRGMDQCTSARIDPQLVSGGLTGVTNSKNAYEPGIRGILRYKVLGDDDDISSQLTLSGLFSVPDEPSGRIPEANRSQEKQELAGLHSINLVSVAVSACLLWLASWLYLSGRSVPGIGTALYAFGGALFRIDPFSLLGMLR
jgi:hypothetical protein